MVMWWTKSWRLFCGLGNVRMNFERRWSSLIPTCNRWKYQVNWRRRSDIIWSFCIGINETETPSSKSKWRKNCHKTSEFNSWKVHTLSITRKYTLFSWIQKPLSFCSILLKESTPQINWFSISMKGLTHLSIYTRDWCSLGSNFMILCTFCTKQIFLTNFWGNMKFSSGKHGDTDALPRKELSFTW